MLRFSLLILLIFPVLLNAQTKFEKGYLLTSNGDSIQGYIRNVNWLYSPEKITYKNNLEGESTTLGVEDLREFRLDGGPRFIVVKDSFPVTERFLKDKTASLNPRMVEREVLVKQLVFGTATLYEYRAGNEVVYLVGKDGLAPQPLRYKQYITNINDIRENKIYRRQLLQLLNCNTTDDIQQVEYTEKSLRSYVLSYNRCVGDDTAEIEVFRNTSNNKVELRLLAFGGIMNYQFESTITGLDAEFESKISPTVGLELESILPFNNKKWSIFLSGQYATYSSAGTISGNGVTIDVANIDLDQLIFNFGGRHYMFFDESNSLFLQGGLNFDYNIQGDFELQPDVFAVLTDIEPLNFGGFVGAGYSFKQRYYLNAKYFFGASINKNPADENNLSRVAVSLGIKL